MTKYGNRKTVIDGITFDSKAEAERYLELCVLLSAGYISKLKVHPSFEIIPAYKRWDENKQKMVTIRATHYEADFWYAEMHDGTFIKWITEDVKGVKTPVYQIKRKLFEQRYPEYNFREIAA
jgi:hypothetical protein